jgi:hypothetical protein
MASRILSFNRLSFPFVVSLSTNNSNIWYKKKVPGNDIVSYINNCYYCIYNQTYFINSNG